MINLKNYDIDPLHGFLPGKDPLTQLPQYFAAWDKIASELPLLVMAGRTLDVFHAMPLLDASKLKSVEEQRRALLLLAGFANAFVAVGGGLTIPKAIAVPLILVSHALDMKAISTHGTIVLNNWRRLDVNKPLSLENLDTLLSFRGSIDEKWFFLATLGVELTGAPAIPWLIKALEAENDVALIEALNAITAILGKVTSAFMRMKQSCDPYIFYNHVRPFLAGWSEQGAVYEGTGLPPIKLNGGSAAQSSLLQAIDATLGITHQHLLTSGFIHEMRDYMPPKHRAFIEKCEEMTQVRARSQGVAKEAYNNAVAAMDELRRKHIGLVSSYITKQMPKDAAAIGTGGTSFNDFLRQSRIETVTSKIEPLYRSFSQAELDKAYSPSSKVASIEPYLKQYADESLKVRATTPPLVLKYGASSEQTIDFFPIKNPKAPILVFIHGGYWQALSKDDASFPAPALNDAGYHYAAVNYTLAPHATMDEIVDEVREALLYLDGEFNTKIVLTGHSAGAHLAAMMLTQNLPFISAAILLGGIYDLQPIRQSYVNEAIKMDEEEALRNSPLFLKPQVDCPLVVAWAQADTDEFKRQSQELIATWKPHNCVSFEQTGVNHFDSLFDWVNPKSRLFSETVKLTTIADVLVHSP